MNTAYESFSDHPETSTYDIAFLTVSDISNQIGVSKSKLYKDIREGKLLAEKSLDDTLVVSPKALQQAYQQIDLSALIDADFPAPDFLNDADHPTDGMPKNGLSPIERVGASLDQPCKSQPFISGEFTELASAHVVKNANDGQSDTDKGSVKTPSGSQKARIIGFGSVVVICSAILVSVFANI